MIIFVASGDIATAATDRFADRIAIAIIIIRGEKRDQVARVIEVLYAKRVVFRAHIDMRKHADEFDIGENIQFLRQFGELQIT